MVTGSIDENEQDDRMEMLKAFDETKGGVKGLIDSGILPKLPSIFVRPSEELAQDYSTCEFEETPTQVPTIDLSGFRNPDRRNQIVEQVRNASETWGFFQVVNHGIPESVLDGMIDGVRGFHEEDAEEKKKYYTRDRRRDVRYNSSYDLFTSRTASWRDTLTISFNSGTHSLDPDQLPPTCRESSVEYSKHVEILGNTLLGLLSEALGLKSDHLRRWSARKGIGSTLTIIRRAPQPELAIGTTKHSDAGFLTILLQNQTVSGLQVLYQDKWIDIHPIPGGLVVNIGDLLQLVSNGKFKSNEHRAKANLIGPRVSVACFFSGPFDGAKTYGPIKEVITEDNPPIYREVELGEYGAKFLTTGLDHYRGLDYYKL